MICFAVECSLAFTGRKLKNTLNGTDKISLICWWIRIDSETLFIKEIESTSIGAWSADEEVNEEEFCSKSDIPMNHTTEQKMETKKGNNKRKDQNNKRRDPNVRNKVEGEWRKRGQKERERMKRWRERWTSKDQAEGK